MITSTSVYYNSDLFLATRAVLKIGEFLNNRVFLSRNYRLIVAPRKVGVRKQTFARDAKRRGQVR